jgi:hypothetical protein
VAITFNDLPSLSQNPETSYWAETMDKLLAKLKSRHVPATGFANEEQPEGFGGAAAGGWARRRRPAWPPQYEAGGITRG